MSDTNHVLNTKERNEFFEAHWPVAMKLFIAMSLAPEKIPLPKLMEALGHMMSIVNDLREVDVNQQAEIASLKACLQMKEK